MKALTLLIIITNLALADNGNPQSKPASQAIMSRQDVLSHMEAAVALSQQIKDALPDHGKVVLEQARTILDQLAPTILPESITGPTRDSIIKAASKIISVQYSDSEYINLLMKVQLMQLRLGLVYESMFPLPDKDTLRKVDANINTICIRAEDVLDKQLVGSPPLFTVDEVHANIGQIHNKMKDAMNDPLSLYFKRPIDDAQIDTIIRDFSDRLKNGHNRILAQLGSQTAGSQANDKVVASDKEFEKSRVFMPIDAWLMHMSYDATVDPSRNVDISKDIEPTFRDVQAALTARQFALFKQAAVKQWSATTQK